MAGNKNLVIMDQFSNQQGNTALACNPPSQELWTIQDGPWLHKGLWHIAGHSEVPVQYGGVGPYGNVW